MLKAQDRKSFLNLKLFDKVCDVDYGLSCFIGCKESKTDELIEISHAHK